MNILKAAAELQGEMVQLRRDLHQRPELGLQLPFAQERVLNSLDGLGIELAEGDALTSVVGVLRGDRPGPNVLLRADMDALPLEEATGLPFASKNRGVMHACGHDLHTAALVGAARLLADNLAAVRGSVVFMFQPGEEGFDGAKLMIEEGVLDVAGERVSAAYGLHVFSAHHPFGVFAGRAHSLMGAADQLLVRVRGRGGHGAAPHLAADPIPAACEMVTALQTLVTRRVDVFDPAVITVGRISAGTCSYVIPDRVDFEATVRTFSRVTRERIASQAIQLCQNIASAHGLEVEATYSWEYPPTVNDPGEFEFAAATVRDVFGPDRFAELEHPIAGAEDFSRVLAEVPGAFLFLGAGKTEDHASAAYNHSAQADFDEAVLSDAAALLAKLAIRRLNLQAPRSA